MPQSPHDDDNNEEGKLQGDGYYIRRYRRYSEDRQYAKRLEEGFKLLSEYTDTEEED